MNYLELNTKSDLKNIYILTGDDFLISKTIKEVSNKLKVNNINISKFNDENFDMLTILNTCNQFSFFNEKRIIVIEYLTGELKTADKNQILKYIESPNADCCLLIVDNSGTFAFLKDVEKIDCLPSDKYLSDYIKNQFEKYNKFCDFAVIQKLTEYCRGNLNRITIEIKKICDYLGEKEKVEATLVDELVVKDIELKVFDLTTSMAQKNIQKSHKVLYDMLKSGEPPIKILGLISGFFRRMFFAKINKNSDVELAKELGCKEYAIKKAREQSSLFTAKELKTIQHLILQADYDIKNGNMQPENVLYYLIFKITAKND